MELLSETSVADASAAKLVLSVIVPIYNEAENISPLFERLFTALDKLHITFEIIAVNDGSRDGSLDRLRDVARKRPELKIVDFGRNFGQTAAIMGGIDFASGDILLSIDADLQNDPEDIPLLIAKLDEGYDVVSGWRKERKDAPIRRKFLSQIANRIISYISGVRLHDYGCSLKAYRRDIIKNVRLYGEMHRFIPIYAYWLGAKIVEVPVRHHPRTSGHSKYGLERVFKVTLDLLVVAFLDRYLTKPIYVFGGFGLLSMIASFLVAGLVLYWKIFEGVSIIATPIPLLATLLFLVGFISLMLGILAELVVRTYFEAQGRTIYWVRKTINIREPD
jgi:glycosyltransferase involved in cell wall biosynthesis